MLIAKCADKSSHVFPIEIGFSAGVTKSCKLGERGMGAVQGTRLRRGLCCPLMVINYPNHSWVACELSDNSHSEWYEAFDLFYGAREANRTLPQVADFITLLNIRPHENLAV